jgi:hypothetical protein
MPQTLEGARMTKIHWVRIIVGAIALELALIVVFVPLLTRVDMSILAPIITLGCLAFGFAWAWWVVRKIQGGYVLHATATGILATVIYLGLCLGNPDGGIRAVVAMYGPFYFIIANLVRILGCAAGGYSYQVRGKV